MSKIKTGGLDQYGKVKALTGSALKWLNRAKHAAAIAYYLLTYNMATATLTMDDNSK